MPVFKFSPNLGLSSFTIILTGLFSAYVLTGFSACQQPPETPRTPPPPSMPLKPGDTLAYYLAAPDQIVNLANDDLQEISGLGATDVPDRYVAIADEKGEIFFVNANEGGSIEHRVLFREKGDFEGVEMVGQTLYAVKSDGKVFEITNWKKGAKLDVKEHDTHLNKDDDVEGLGYDPYRNALLLACKGNPDSDAKRNIYAFDLKEKKLSDSPVYTIDPTEVARLVPDGPEDKPNFFSPSGIAIHPKTGEIFVTSTAKKRLVVLDYNTGQIRFANRLDKKVMPQPEGISFDAAGNLLISSEGKKGEGLLLKFNYRK